MPWRPPSTCPRKHRDAQVDAGCPLPATLAEVARLPEGFREVLSRHVEIMVASLAESPEETDVALADLVLMIGGLALARALGPGSCPTGFRCRQAGGELRRCEMSSLTWIRGFNGTIGRIAPRWTAERMRRTFMVPGEWPPGRIGSYRCWPVPERVTLRFGLSVLRWGEGRQSCCCMAGPAGRHGRPSDRATGRRGLFGVCPRCAGPWPLAGQGGERGAVRPCLAGRPLASPPLRAVVGHSLGGAAALLAAQMGLRSEALVTVSAPSRILEQLRLFARFVGLPAWLARISSAWSSVSLAYPRRALDVARYRLKMPGLVVHADDDTRVAVEMPSASMPPGRPVA